jgi:hypothetical protein
MSPRRVKNPSGKIFCVRNWARRFVGLSDVRDASRLLREMVLGTLHELASLPAKVTDPNWLDILEGDASPSATVETEKASGSKGRSV